jgi:hypothetical protein
MPRIVAGRDYESPSTPFTKRENVADRLGGNLTATVVSPSESTLECEEYRLNVPGVGKSQSRFFPNLSDCSKQTLDSWYEGFAQHAFMPSGVAADES